MVPGYTSPSLSLPSSPPRGGGRSLWSLATPLPPSPSHPHPLEGGGGGGVIVVPGYTSPSPEIASCFCRPPREQEIRRSLPAFAAHQENRRYGDRFLLFADRLAGIMVNVSTSRAEDTGFVSRLRRDFSGSSHTNDLKTGTPVAILPGAWCYGVSAWTGWTGVSVLKLGEIPNLSRNLYLSVAARPIV